MLQFDDETQAILNAAYSGEDFARRRALNADAIRLSPGQTVLDLGCGNGFQSAELAQIVGDTGRVIGIDPSAEMLSAARTRCKSLPNVDLRPGAADALPLDDNSVDAVVSVQVFEYIADLTAALREAARVTKPGGRIVIGDMHFGTWVWNSDHPDRMRAMMDSWNHHVAHTDTPALLPSTAREAGLAVEDIQTLTFADHRLKPDGMAQMLMILMTAYATEKGHLDVSAIADWQNEQTALDDRGRFFHSITHFVTVLRIPEA